MVRDDDDEVDEVVLFGEPEVCVVTAVVCDTVVDSGAVVATIDAVD